MAKTPIIYEGDISDPKKKLDDLQRQGEKGVVVKIRTEEEAPSRRRRGRPSLDDPTGSGFSQREEREARAMGFDDANDRAGFRRAAQEALAERRARADADRDRSLQETRSYRDVPRDPTTGRFVPRTATGGGGARIPPGEPPVSAAPGDPNNEPDRIRADRPSNQQIRETQRQTLQRELDIAVQGRRTQAAEGLRELMRSAGFTPVEPVDPAQLMRETRSRLRTERSLYSLQMAESTPEEQRRITRERRQAMEGPGGLPPGPDDVYARDYARLRQRERQFEAQDTRDAEIERNRQGRATRRAARDEANVFQGSIQAMRPNAMVRAVRDRMGELEGPGGLPPGPDDIYSREYLSLQRQERGLRRQTGWNTNILPGHLWMQGVFGAFELSRAMSSIQMGEVNAGVAHSPLEALEARVQGITGATSGFIGATLGEASGVFGGGIPAIQRSIVVEKSRYKDLEDTRALVRQNKASEEELDALHNIGPGAARRLRILAQAEETAAPLRERIAQEKSALNDPADIGFWNTAALTTARKAHELLGQDTSGVDNMRRQIQDEANAIKASSSESAARRVLIKQLEKQAQMPSRQAQAEIDELDRKQGLDNAANNLVGAQATDLARMAYTHPYFQDEDATLRQQADIFSAQSTFRRASGQIAASEAYRNAGGGEQGANARLALQNRQAGEEELARRQFLNEQRETQARFQMDRIGAQAAIVAAGREAVGDDFGANVAKLTGNMLTAQTQAQRNASGAQLSAFFAQTRMNVGFQVHDMGREAQATELAGQGRVDEANIMRIDSQKELALRAARFVPGILGGNQLRETIGNYFDTQRGAYTAQRTREVKFQTEDQEAGASAIVAMAEGKTGEAERIQINAREDRDKLLAGFIPTILGGRNLEASISARARAERNASLRSQLYRTEDIAEGLGGREEVTGLAAGGLEKSAQAAAIRNRTEDDLRQLRRNKEQDTPENEKSLINAGVNDLKTFQRQLEFMQQNAGSAVAVAAGTLGRGADGTAAEGRIEQEPIVSGLKAVEDAINNLTQKLVGVP
jgi:hypothetical protein